MPRKKKVDDQTAPVAAPAPAAPKKIPRFRVFNCMQYEVNPKTGQSLNFNEQNILNAIKHKSITRYAYIKHDKDVITEADIESGKGMYTDADLGKQKGDHWHIVLEAAENALSIATVAKWLGIPENFVEIPNGRGAFMDCVEYLRHSDIRQALKGKYDYDASEVKANFDWEVEVEKIVLRKTKYEKPLSEEEYIRNEVLYHGLSLREVQQKYPTYYQEKLQIFKRLRLEYISTLAEMPPFRVNYYIEGMSGYGKDTMAYSIARSLFPDLGDDAYFEVGAKKVTLDGYDGEPVIIWSEFRAETFLDTFSGYEDVLSAIDIIPKKKKREHKKFGDVRLINSVNIVTSTQPFSEFQKGLISQTDPDPTQINRRIPIWIKIHKEDFDIAINSGYLDADNYADYKTWQNVKGSFGLIASKLDRHKELQDRIGRRLIAPVISASERVKEGISPDPFDGMTDDEIMKEFEDYGTVQNLAEVMEERAITLSEEYASWLVEDFFPEHPNAPATKNYPTFEWWLSHIKKEIPIPFDEDEPTEQLTFESMIGN